MGGGLLIFYVANVANVANVSKVHFCRILRQTHRILPYFAADFLTQKQYLCTEFQSALNTAYPKTACAKSYAHRNYARNACPGTQALSGYAGVPAC